MNEKEFEQAYQRLARTLEASRAPMKLPRKHTGGKPTKDALVLVYLFINMGKPVTKSKLTEMIRTFYPGVNDVQQARHLAAQKGYWIESGTRGDKSQNLKANEYMLVRLTDPYPGWKNHRGKVPANFKDMKKQYMGRCATCGSEEGKPNYINPAVTTKLQAGHMDPRKKLDSSNTIPQCGVCNQAYRDWFIFYSNGRVRTINPESPRWAGVSDIADEIEWTNRIEN